MCGDGLVFAGIEDCDDGNADDADACKTDCSAATCGDSVVWTSTKISISPHSYGATRMGACGF